ncbi:MAG: DNA polymerase, partial [Firmicutes bacterium]|nr:DNA polymerase [Bacillota bacterium]
KAVNFGIIYGISDWGLSTDLKIPVSAAHKYILKYFLLYPKVKAYMDACVADAKAKGYAETMYGRIRVIPELRSDNRTLRAFGERAAMNMPLQGAAADLIKVAMIRIYRRLKHENLKSRIILQVHDELVIEAEEAEADRAASIMVEEMENAAKLSVPLKVDCGRGYSLYEVK